MHIIRAIPACGFAFAAIFYSPKALGVISLDEMMTADEKKKTGVSTLSQQQKQELDKWLNLKLTVKTENKDKAIFLSENINSGQRLKLSDDSIYEIAPADRGRAEFWLTPFQVKLEPSGDPAYPVKITNLVTQISVKAKQVQAPSS